MSILRDIFRRKGRSILTIIGISVGVFALVVLGAVAENQNTYVSVIFDAYEGTVHVIEERDAGFLGQATGSRPLSMDTVEEIRSLPEVDAAYPMVSLFLEGDFMSVTPPMVLGISSASPEYTFLRLAEGRGIEEGDERVAVLGADLAKQAGAAVGETFEIRDVPFTVVGIFERSYVNVSDASAHVPLTDAQRLYHTALPEAFQDVVDAEDLAIRVSVVAAEGTDPDELATQLNRDIDGILATGPTEAMERVSGLVGLLNSIVWSVAAIALIVCALSIVNTMTMAVSERTREIGVKRALGATRWRIARDVLVESGVMGGIGGLIGLLAGGATAFALNSAMVAATGTTVMVVTGRLAFGALAFAVILGIIGGLWPARHASRLEPARALAYE